MTALLVLLTRAHAACPDPQPALARAMDSLVAGDPEAAKRSLADVEDAFACAPLTPAVLARHWLARGALADQEGEGASPWFAVARHVSPETWEPRLGPVLRAVWDRAAAPSASLAIDPGGHAWLDGTLVTAWPVPSTAGPHLVQVLDPTGAVTFARVVTLLPGERALVETGITAPSVPAQALAQASTVTGASTPALASTAAHPARRRRTLLASGAGALLTVGGVASWQARAQNDAMTRAPDLDTLDKAYGAQVAWAWTAWGALGAGTACAIGAAVVR